MYASIDFSGKFLSYVSWIVLDFWFSSTAWKSVAVIPVWNWPFCQLSNRASSDLHQCTQASPASPGREIQDFKVSVLY